jgi:hypothetical protein
MLNNQMVDVSNSTVLRYVENQGHPLKLATWFR